MSLRNERSVGSEQYKLDLRTRNGSGHSWKRSRRLTGSSAKARQLELQYRATNTTLSALTLCRYIFDSPARHAKQFSPSPTMASTKRTGNSRLCCYVINWVKSQKKTFLRHRRHVDDSRCYYHATRYFPLYRVRLGMPLLPSDTPGSIFSTSLVPKHLTLPPR